MSYEKLTSEKVNYLIWRYLQEAGFGQAAARLQHDWGLQYHPDDLPFAKHIGPRSLIKLLHYGLKLHRIQTSDKPNASPFFGPDPDSLIAPTESVTINAGVTSAAGVAGGSRTKSSSPSRRLDSTTTTNQSSLLSTTQPPTLTAPPSTSKPRNRRNNGLTTTTTTNGKSRGTNSGGGVAVTTGGESMDVDQSGGTVNTRHENDMDIDENDPSKKKTFEGPLSSVSSPARNGEQQQQQIMVVANGLETIPDLNHQIRDQQPILIPLPIPTLTNGTSIGIQSDKVIELAPMTTILNTSSIKNSILSHAEWNPANSKTASSYLAIGGRELGQMWEINKGESRSHSIADINQATSISATAGQYQASRRFLNAQNIINLDVGSAHTLVSLAWSHDGDTLAYSVLSDSLEKDQRSVIKTKSCLNGRDGDSFSTLSEAVTNLAWNRNNRFIAGISSTSVIVLDTQTGTQSRPLEVEHILFDITWLEQETLAICGDSYIAVASIVGTNINVSHVFTDTAGSIEWTKLRYDIPSSSIAVVSDTSGDLAVIEVSGQAYKEDGAHSSGIVDMVFQPVVNNISDQARILVTSATDGLIKIWKSKSGISLVQTLAMGGISQALSLSFSPDGNILAVADWDKVLLWDIRQGVQPRFKWELRRVDWQSLTNGHTPNGVNHDHDISMDEAENEAPILRWDGPGHSLTFAHKDKIAMIEVPF